MGQKTLKYDCSRLESGDDNCLTNVGFVNHDFYQLFLVGMRLGSNSARNGLGDVK